MKPKFFAVTAAALLLAGCAAQPAAPAAQTESADPLTLTFFIAIFNNTAERTLTFEKK